MEAALNCPCCGRENSVGSNFCVFCGHALNGKTRHKDEAVAVRMRAGHFSVAAPVIMDGRWFLIDDGGSVIAGLPYRYDMTVRDEVGTFHEGYARVRSGGKTGYTGMNGEVVIEATYEDGSSCFSDGLVAVRSGEYWGYLNAHGGVAIPFVFQHADDFSHGMAAVEMNGKWGYIDRAGRTVIPFIFDSAKAFSSGYACVEYGGGYGFIDMKGFAVPFKGKTGVCGLERIFNFGKSVLAGMPPLKDSEGRYVLSLPFRKVSSHNGNVAVVVMPGKRGDITDSRRYKYINVSDMDFLDFKSGVENDFGTAGDFSEGLAAVSKGKFVEFGKSLWNNYDDLGYINWRGEVIRSFHLSRAFPFREGMALVGFRDKGADHTGYIDKNGKLMLDYDANEYSLWTGFSNGLAPIAKRIGGVWKYGYINMKGETVIPIRFDRAGEFGK